MDNDYEKGIICGLAMSRSWLSAWKNSTFPLAVVIGHFDEFADLEIARSTKRVGMALSPSDTAIPNPQNSSCNPVSEEP